MSSPRRERPHSPLYSDSGTPRGPLSYPPSPANLASPRSSVPPPLLLKRDSDTAVPSPLSTPPLTGISYTSPTAIEMAQSEIKRLRRTSSELQSSLVPPPRPSRTNSSTGSMRKSSLPFPLGESSIPLEPIVSNDPPRQDIAGHEDPGWSTSPMRSQRNGQGQGGNRNSTASGYGYAV